MGWPRPEAGQPDAAREKQIDLLRLTELKRGGVLEKERTLLGEEQIEARQVDLLLVGFDLGEVGVHREIQRQVRPDPPLESTPTSPLRSS